MIFPFKLKAISLFIFLFLFANSYSQNTFKTLFIEPNISITYDTLKFKLGNRYSNTFYETESYDFHFNGDTLSKTNIHIKANHSAGGVDINTTKNKYQKAIEAGKKEIMSDSLSDYISMHDSVLIIHDFVCFGMKVQDSLAKRKYLSINGVHYSENDLTELEYTSINNEDVESNLKVLTSFLQGFKSYTPKEISQEESLIKSLYTVNIELTDTSSSENLKWRENALFATVTTNEKLKHTIKEVRLKMEHGEEVFKANEKGEVPIAFFDETKGIIERKGDLIILNSFGKQVKLPFSFTYENK